MVSMKKELRLIDYYRREQFSLYKKIVDSSRLMCFQIDGEICNVFAEK